MIGRRRAWLWAVGALTALATCMAGAIWLWREDIAEALLDPGVPYPLYQPPPAPDYTRPAAWALLPSAPARFNANEPMADVFFVHPTTYDHGRQWNGAVVDPRSAEELARIMLPNYAGPFQQIGRVFAPRYRQAGLYSFSTLRDDARAARRFAYGDVRAAFDSYINRWSGGRPLIIAGVEQGAELAARLASETAADPRLRGRLVAVYLQNAVVPAARYGLGSALPACRDRRQVGCVVAWAQAPPGGDDAARILLDRALVWSAAGGLENLDGRLALCVNPVTGTEHGASGREEARGAVDASGVEWGARPAFMPRQISATCRGGLLWVSKPNSPSLRSVPPLVDPQRAPPYNLFYADIEADAKARLAAATSTAHSPPRAPVISDSISVRSTPVHRID